MLDEAIHGGVGAKASDQRAAVGGGAENRDILTACSLDVAPRLAAAGLTVEWVGLMESVLPARNQYPAPEPGTDRGSWLVGGAAAARSRGIPMIKRYGIEGDPTYFEFMKQHFRDHGLDPAGDCLLQAAVEVAAGRARWPKVEHPEDDWGSRPLGALDQAAEQLQGGNGRDDSGRPFDAHLIVEVGVPTATEKKTSELGSKVPVPPRSAFSKPVSDGLIREIAFD
jgi:hypothetical protein